MLLDQGLILMATGFGAVFAFLVILVFVVKGFEYIAPKIAFILPDPQPKALSRPASGKSDADFALAIAVALKRTGR